jgi:hypothetical protein
MPRLELVVAVLVDELEVCSLRRSPLQAGLLGIDDDVRLAIKDLFRDPSA